VLLPAVAATRRLSGCVNARAAVTAVVSAAAVAGGGDSRAFSDAVRRTPILTEDRAVSGGGGWRTVVRSCREGEGRRVIIKRFSTAI